MLPMCRAVYGLWISSIRHLNSSYGPIDQPGSVIIFLNKRLSFRRCGSKIVEPSSDGTSAIFWHSAIPYMADDPRCQNQQPSNNQLPPDQRHWRQSICRGRPLPTLQCLQYKEVTQGLVQAWLEQVHHQPAVSLLDSLHTLHLQMS